MTDIALVCFKTLTVIHVIKITLSSTDGAIVARASYEYNDSSGAFFHFAFAIWKAANQFDAV